MARRSVQRRPPVVRFQADGRYVLADVVDLSATHLYVRCAVRPPSDRPVAFEWGGAARTTLTGRVVSVAEAAPDGRHGLLVELSECSSLDGAEQLSDFVRRRLGLLNADTPTPSGATYKVRLRADSGEAAAPAHKQPALRSAGVSVLEAPDPLVTGRGPTTVDALQATLDAAGHKLGLYVNAPCAYWLSGAQYWGRAVRVSDRWVQVNTNAVVPGLGVRIRCDITTELDGARRPVGIYGVLGKRQELGTGGPYKAQLWVSVQSIDEAESPGLLAVWLERVARERRERGEPDAE